MNAAPLDLVGTEGARVTSSHRAPPGRLAFAGVVAVVIWAGYQLGIGRRALVNGAGWGEVGKFFSAALRPATDAPVVRSAFDGALTTLSYAVLGTVGSALIGVPLGIAAATGWRSQRRRLVLPRVLRALLIPARGSHEIIWALLLLNVLGLNPLVAIIAIAVPFGAITAKVVHQLIDDTPTAPAEAVRATGARSSAVLVVGIAPRISHDVSTYLAYRFECALRAAAVLGVAGAGGLGQELRLSFMSVRYDEMWTFFYVLIALGGIADMVSARLRHPRRSARPTSSRRRRAGLAGITVGIVATVFAWRHLNIDIGTLWSQRTRRLAGEVGDRWFPPDLARGHLRLLASLATQTLAISIVSAVLAMVVAVPCAFVAARPPSAHWLRRSIGAAVRLVLLTSRAIPPSVWAFVAVLVLLPGPLPAAVALAIYNGGVLGRLLAESVENLPRPPLEAVLATGATSAQTWAIGMVPMASRRFATYGLYRWEVALRETIVVGIVAAGGLGQHIGSRLAAFDYPQVTAAVAAMIALTVIVDVVSARLRAAVIGP